MTWETTAANLATTLGGNGWLAMCGYALSIAFFVVGLAYMIGSGLNIIEVKRWAESEFFQALASALIVGLLFITVEGESYAVRLIQNQTELIAGGVLLPEMAGDARVSPYDFAYVWLKNMLDCAKEVWKENYKENKLYEIILTTAATPGRFEKKSGEKKPEEIVEADVAPLPVPIFTLNFGILIPFFRQKMEQYHFHANNAVWFALALYFQYHFLRWVETSMFTVFLPVGIVLRIFPYTRGAGGFLIALAIGLYIVYPLFFLIVLSSRAPPSECEPVEYEIEAPYCPQDPAAALQLMKEAQAKAALEKKDVRVEEDWLIYGFFFPLVILVATFAFVRAISPFLGAEISEIGRSLFKLL